MDHTEDLSARVLLRNILSTEPPRTPITRSVKKAQSQQSPGTTRRSRPSNKDGVGQTPQDILRRSLRQKMRESITRKSLLFTKRRTGTQRESRTSAASMSFDSGDTPRHILRNILMTEPVRSPVVHKKTKTEEPQPSPANSSLTGKTASIELSGLDLPDVTVDIASSFKKVLSRKRPRRSLNVTAFEKRLKGADDVGEEREQSANEHSSLSFSSSTSLSLKTPFADVQTEKRGLQRRVLNRRKITEEEFIAAMETGGTSSFVGLGPSDTVYSEGLTLGLSKLSKPDITTDIIHRDTTVDFQTDATACEAFQSEEESRSRSQYLEEEAARDSQTEEGDGDPGPKAHASARSGLVEEEDETAEDTQTEEGDEDSQTEVDGSTRSRSQEDEETGQKSEEECGGDSQAKIDVSARPQSVEEEEEETAQGSQTETGDDDSQTEVDGSTRSQSQEDEETGQKSEEECGGDSQSKMETAQGSQTKEVSAVDCHSEEEEDIANDEMDHRNSTKEDLPHSQDEDEELEDGGDGHQSEEQEQREHLSYRDRCSGGGAMHATEPDGVASESDTIHYEDARNNSSEGSRRLEAAAQDSAELEEEWEDEEENEEVPSKTPAFVRQKRVFSQPYIKNAQPSGPSKSSPAKPKQVRKTSRRAEREPGLPKSYLMNVFKHFAKTRVSPDVYPVLKEVMDRFFQRLVEDLETYAVHAKRKTIEVEDAELLLRRQGHVNDKVPVEVLIEKYLRLDQRKLLIPIATRGNVVIPKKR